MTDLESNTHTTTCETSDDFEENTVKVNSNLKPGKSKITLKPPWVPAPGNSSIPSGTLKPSLKVAQIISTYRDCDSNVDFDPVKRSKSARELRVQKAVHPVAVVHSKSAYLQKHHQNQSNNSQRKKSRYKRPSAAGGSGSTTYSSRTVDKNNNDNFTKLGKMSDLTLKSKDSLLDVTQTLQEKREQVMALWNISSYKDQHDKVIFIRELEKANKLAIEASEEVEHLRNSIKRLQEKPQLSLEDSKQLEDLRTNVLLKLKSFEEVNSVVSRMFKAQKEAQEKKVEIQESGENISTSDSTSSTRTDGSSSNPEIITIKKVNPNFAQNLPSGNSNENVEKIEQSENCENVAEDLPQKVECAESKSSFSLDLDNLNKLYGEIYTFESPSQIIMQNRAKSSKSRSKAPTIKSQYSSTSSKVSCGKWRKKFEISDSELSEIYEEQSHEFEYEKPDVKCSKKSYNYNYKGHSKSRSRYYRNKLSSVQDKLSQTEEKVDQLSKSLHRIESQSEFDIKMLKTNIQDKLEELEPMPELLYMAEKKMNETQKHRQSIEKKLKTKNKELMREKAKTELLQFELKKLSLGQNQGTRSKPRDFDEDTDDLKVIQKLKKVNNQLKKELRDRERQLDDEFRCKDQVMDLQRELSESRREISRLKEDKEREIQFMGKRIDDLVEQLNESRKRNKLLTKQLHIIRTSYHDIFPEYTTGTTGNGSTAGS